MSKAAPCRTRRIRPFRRTLCTGIVGLLFVHVAAAETRWLLPPVVDAYPSPSPDGRSIVFQSTRSGRTALYLADIDGSHVRLLLDTGHNPVSPAWSPDGRAIAFASNVDEDSEIHVMAVDGESEPVRLTAIQADDSHPAWSADSQRIFFSSNRHTQDQRVDFYAQVHDIYSMRADGTDLRQHTDCKAVCTYPSPSPDGRSLAYRKLQRRPGKRWDQAPMEFDSEVMVSDLDGANERSVSDHPAFDGWPSWSPDGRWIAFASNRGGSISRGQIYLVRPDGSKLHALTDGDWSHTQPRWSASGTTVYSYRHHETAELEYGAIGTTPVPAGTTGTD